MRIHIVTNIDNGKGLERDYRLLGRLLESFGHEVTGVHFQRKGGAPPADLAIFLEVYEPRLAEKTPRKWLIPNAEWWQPEDVPRLSDFELVLCKTRDGLARFAPLTPRTRYIGFFSEDRFDPSVPRVRRFLHIAGGSRAKGTDSVLAAWERHRIPYPLTVVTSLDWGRRPRNVEIIGPIDERRLRAHQNAARFHLCPSRYEGWGHVLHEGLSTGAAVVVADTPAMREIDGAALRVPASPRGQQGLVPTHAAAPEDVRDAVERCMAFTEADLARIAVAAREAFLSERERCIAALRELLGQGAAAGTPGETGILDTERRAGEARDRLARAVRSVAVPALRGLYGGVVVAGEAAELIAQDVVRLCGLAARAVSPAELAELPANHACGAILSDTGASSTPAESGRARSLARRIVKAAGPLVIAERDGDEIRVLVEHVGV